MKNFDTPVLFLVFNRPETTEVVFERIREMKPASLYIAADGPRVNVSGEGERCRQVKDIFSNIDWDCEVKTLYREENLGCGLAVSNAIDWFFENVEDGIILEDDTLPDQSFFYYCEKMLNLYREDLSVLHISGNNFQSDTRPSKGYFFTRLPFIWGWATWKRAWGKYKYDYKYLSNNDRNDIIENVFGNSTIAIFWKKLMQDFHLKPISYTWDYQWFLSIWKNQGLVIQPGSNLVTNIGFSEDATHTKDRDHHLSALKINPLPSVPEIKLPISIDKKRELSNFNFYFLNNKKTIKVPGNSFIKKSIALSRKLFAKIIVKLYPEISVVSNDNVSFHMIESYKLDSSFGKNTKLYPPYRLENVQLGNYSYVAENAQIFHTTIGKFCSIGPNITCGLGIHPVNGITTSPMFYSVLKQNGTTLSDRNKIDERKPIVIGNDVFIGANVIILDGVTIGDGAVIGAGSIVSKDIPPFAIAVGSPIKVIKYRFSDDEITALLKIQWWNFEDDKLPEVEKNFFDVKAFIKKFGF